MVTKPFEVLPLRSPDTKRSGSPKLCDLTNIYQLWRLRIGKSVFNQINGFERKNRGLSNLLHASSGSAGIFALLILSLAKDGDRTCLPEVRVISTVIHLTLMLAMPVSRPVSYTHLTLPTTPYV